MTANQPRINAGIADLMVQNSIQKMWNEEFSPVLFRVNATLKEIDSEEGFIQEFNGLINQSKPLLEKIYENNPDEKVDFIDNLIVKLENYLSKIDFSTKKGLNGKRCGNAVLENLVILCLSTKKFDKAKSYSEIFSKENEGLFSEKMTGRTYQEYPVNFSVMMYETSEKNGKITLSYKLNLAHLAFNFEKRFTEWSK